MSAKYHRYHTATRGTKYTCRTKVSQYVRSWGHGRGSVAHLVAQMRTMGWVLTISRPGLRVLKSPTQRDLRFTITYQPRRRARA